MLDGDSRQKEMLQWGKKGIKFFIQDKGELGQLQLEGGSYKFLVLLRPFSLEKQGEFSSELWFSLNPQNRYDPTFPSDSFHLLSHEQ